jgi:negative regulator of genetic competence, sporulation and motility
MELIRIGDSKLKITLTSDDMTQYDLDCDTMDYDNSETRKAFWDILDHAKQITGFDAAGDRVFVQLYPSKKGGCEMYVTKLGLICADRREGERTHTHLSRPAHGTHGVSAPALTPREDGERDRLGAYRFEGLHDLLCVCRQLARRGYDAQSSAYRDEKDRFYLILRERGEGCRLSCGDFCFITEFGTPENAETVRLYISEHGAPICEGNAVSTLSRF